MKPPKNNLTVSAQTPYQLLSALSVSERYYMLSSPKAKSYLESLTPSEYAQLFPGYYRKDKETLSSVGVTKTSLGSTAGTAQPSPSYTGESVTGSTVEQPPSNRRTRGGTPAPSPGVVTSWEKKLEELSKKYVRPEQEKPTAPVSTDSDVDLSKASVSTKMKVVYDSFKKLGYSHNAAKAMVSEVYRENSYQNHMLFGTHRDPYNGQMNGGMLSMAGVRHNSMIKYLGDRGLLDSNGRIKQSSASIRAMAEWTDNEIRNGTPRGIKANPELYRILRDPNYDLKDIHQVLGEKYIKWRINDPKYRSSGLRNMEKAEKIFDENVGSSSIEKPSNNVGVEDKKERPRAKFQDPSIEKRAENLTKETRDALERFRLASPDSQISSTYRSPSHPIEIRKAKPGEHAKGIAIDISTRGKSEEELRVIIQNLKKSGFNSILLEGHPPHIHAVYKANQTDVIIRNLGKGHPTISLESAREAAGMVEYNSLARIEAPQEPSGKKQVIYVGGLSSETSGSGYESFDTQEKNFKKGAGEGTDVKYVRHNGELEIPKGFNGKAVFHSAGYGKVSEYLRKGGDPNSIIIVEPSLVSRERQEQFLALLKKHPGIKVFYGNGPSTGKIPGIEEHQNAKPRPNGLTHFTIPGYVAENLDWGVSDTTSQITLPEYFKDLPEGFRRKFDSLPDDVKKKYLFALEKATPEELEGFKKSVEAASTETQNKIASADPTQVIPAAPAAPGEMPTIEYSGEKSKQEQNFERNDRVFDINSANTFINSRNPVGAKLKQVDPTLMHVTAEGIRNFENKHGGRYSVRLLGPGGGKREGSSSYHAHGTALDFVIIDNRTGKPLTNFPGYDKRYGFQGTVGETAPIYQDLANSTKIAAHKFYPEKASILRWGGYGKWGKNAMDTMHFDFDPEGRGLGYGTFEKGFSKEAMVRYGISKNIPIEDIEKAIEMQYPTKPAARVAKAPTAAAQPTAEPVPEAAPAAAPEAPAAAPEAAPTAAAQPTAEPAPEPPKAPPVSERNARSLYMGGEIPQQTAMPVKQVVGGEVLQARGDTTPIYNNGEYVANYNPRNEIIYYNERSGKSIVEPKNRVNYDQLQGKDVERDNNSREYIDDQMIQNAVDDVYGKLSSQISSSVGSITNKNMQKQMTDMASSTENVTDSMRRYFEKTIFKERGDYAKGNYFNIGQNIRPV